MSGIDDGTNTPPASNGGAQGGEYETQTCPMCGASVKLLPSHFRHDCPATEDGDG
jgi:hypothetical protein